MPKITPAPKSMKAHVGESVWIPCEASGSPNPEIVWMKNFNEVVDKTNPRIHVLPNGTIEIANTTHEDFGSYECIARNIMGEIHSDAVQLGQMQEQLKFIQEPESSIFVDSPAPIVLHCRAQGTFHAS